MADWLATLYHDRKRFWSGLQPDPLAEYLIGTVLDPHGRCPGLVTKTLHRVSAGQLEHGLTVLGRAHPHHPHLTHAITDIVLTTGTAGSARAVAAIAVAPRLDQPQPLLTALEQLVNTADIASLDALNRAMPRYSILLGPTMVKAAVRLVELYRHAAAADRDAYLPGLAMSVNNLANRLAEAGRRVEGLGAAQEAVELYRELVELNRDAYLPDLAKSVNNLANRLAEAGRRVEGLTAAQRAVDLHRELVELNRDAYLPDLAKSVNNLAIRLAEAGRRAEGLTAAQEAVDLHRELVELNRDAYLPALAKSVNNLANRLAEAGRREEALALASEASTHYHDLARTDPDVFGPAADRVDGLVVALGGFSKSIWSRSRGRGCSVAAFDIVRQRIP